MADEKAYKAPEDPERAFYLMNFLNIARDFSQTNALSASFGRELRAMNSRQVERDTREAAQGGGSPPSGGAPEHPTAPPGPAPSSRSRT